MKYFITQDEADEMKKDKNFNMDNFLKDYRPCPWFLFDSPCVANRGWSRNEKPPKDIKNKDDLDNFRLADLENDLNVISEILELQGLTIENAPFIQQIQGLKKRIKEKDFSCLVHEMPFFFFRVSRALARPFIPDVKRGKKVFNGASNGGKERNRKDIFIDHDKIKKELESFLAKTRGIVKGKKLFKQAIAKIIAEKTGDSYKTVERVCKEELKPYIRPREML